MRLHLKNMPADEFIWPLSIPAILPDESEIRVAQFERNLMWNIENI